MLNLTWRNIFGLSVAAVLAGLMLSIPVWGQSTAAIEGTVQDATRAVITDASVSLQNEGTGVKRTTTTNGAGAYIFPLLQPGSYAITVEKPGLETAKRTGIRLDVAQTAKIDFTLHVGTVSQAMVVSGTAELLDTGTAAVGQVVDTRAIDNLPTNGRNSYEFITLTPGVRAPNGFRSVVTDNVSSAFVSINGARPNGSVFYLDGGNNSESNYNGPTYVPPVDAVQEFKVQTSSFGAEYTNTTGGVVNLVTKSGTNRFHGTLFEYLRNNDLDATNFFLNLSGIGKAEYRFNQFGGTLGGPVIKNKTFFFFSYEGLRLVQGVTYTNTLPTAAQRAGDFTETRNAAGQVIAIYDPFSTVPNPSAPGSSIRTPFPGNAIPPARIDPVAHNLLKYLPQPNTTGAPITGNNNFVSNASSPINKDDYSARVDHHFSDNTSLFGRYSVNYEPWETPQPYGAGNPANPNLGLTNFGRYNAVLNGTHIFSPQFLVELSSSFNRWAQTRVGPGVGFDPTQLGLPSYIVAHSAKPEFPVISVSGMNGAASLGNNYGAGLLAAGGVQDGINGFDTIEERVNFTRIAGRHTLKLGGIFGVQRNNTVGMSSFGGVYDFAPGMTQGPNPLLASSTAGLGFASLLMGTPSSGSHPTAQAGMSVIDKYTGVYIGDDFKATSRLTLTFGLRYDYTTPFTERNNRLVNFNTTAQTTLGGIPLTGGLQFVGVNGSSRYSWDPNTLNFAPRFGFAYNLGADTVVRGGFGLFYGPFTGGGFNNNAIPNTGFSCTTALTASRNGGLTPYATLSNPFPDGFCSATGSNAGLLTNLGQTLFYTGRDQKRPYSEQWNLDIQRKLPGNMVFEIGYSGTHGLHLMGTLDINQLPNSDLALGPALIQTAPNPYASIVTSGLLSGGNVPQNQLLRPFPQFLSIQQMASTYGDSIYHSMLTKLEKRLSHGLTFLTAFTWSKLIDDVDATTVGFPGGAFTGGGLQNYNNRRQERALATFDTPFNFSVEAVYELPFGPGKKFLSSANLIDRLLGGWQMNEILTLQSGTPLQIVGGNANQTLAGTQRPNWNGRNPTLGGAISDRLNRYFNTADFSANPLYTFGNSPRTMPDLRAPGLHQLDISLFKNFALHENWKLQFRAEFFNVLNTPEFGLPVTNFNASNFGVVSSQVNAPRDIQFALKLLF
jgi:hypothetical protein